MHDEDFVVVVVEPFGDPSSSRFAFVQADSSMYYYQRSGTFFPTVTYIQLTITVNNSSTSKVSFTQRAALHFTDGDKLTETLADAARHDTTG